MPLVSPNENRSKVKYSHIIWFVVIVRLLVDHKVEVRLLSLVRVFICNLHGSSPSDEAIRQTVTRKLT